MGGARVHHSSDETIGSLRRTLEKEILSWPEVMERTMFGIPAYLAKGTIFALLVDKGVVLTSLTEQQRDDVAHRFPSQPFIGHGNPIPSWIQVSIEQEVDLTPLVPYIRQSYENALLKSVRRH